MLSSFLLASQVNAASVYNCSSSGRKCVVKLEIGKVGDTVKVLDKKARPAAIGRIIKKKGSYGVVSFVEIFKKVRKGFPVLVDVDSENSNLEWAASFSYDDE